MLVILLLLPLAAAAQPPEPARTLRYPERDLGALSLDARRLRQNAALGATDLLWDFRFSDRQPESGITFEHHITDDAGRAYKPVHYDHGNGVAAADVDGDGDPDLYFVNQLGSNGLYENLGEGRFRDVTERAGVGLADRVGVAASFADVDGDGDADLFVTTVKMGNVLFLNDGTGRFRDVSAHAGVDAVGHSSGTVVFDYDGDGRLDLLVTNVGVYTTDERGPGGYFVGRPDAFSGHLMPERAERSLLYRNLGGGRFAEVAEAAGLVDLSWSGDATFTDFDGDGDADVYVLNMQGDDHYYENLGGRFAERTARYFPKTPWGTMGVKFFDFDNDGRQDLYLTDMHSDMVEDVGPDREDLKSRVDPAAPQWQGGENNVFGNAFYVHRGAPPFEERSDALRLENYWPWGVSAGDLNADGFEDLVVTASMNYPFRYGVNGVYLNDRGRRFVDAAVALGVEPRRGRATAKPWFDLDCSGGDRGHPLCKERDGRWTVLGSLGSRSSVILDLDQDGDLDVVTNEFNAPPQVLISDLAQRHPVRFLQVALEGRASNRDGLGARVVVHAGERAWTRYHDGKSGYLSQSRLPLYFGLGDATAVDRVEVFWPSGKTQVVSEVAIGTTLVVTEPE